MGHWVCGAKFEVFHQTCPSEHTWIQNMPLFAYKVCPKIEHTLFLNACSVNCTRKPLRGHFFIRPHLQPSDTLGWASAELMYVLDE